MPYIPDLGLAKYYYENVDKMKIKSLNPIGDVMSHYISVQPHVFDFLITLSIALPIKVEDADWTKHYFVVTKKSHSKNRNQGFLHFVTDEVSANAIKQLLRNDIQFTFPDKKGLPFDEAESILKIKGVPFRIRRNSDRFHICKLLFGDAETFGKQWKHDDFLSKYLDPKDLDELDNLYTYLYHKIRHLNEEISKAGIDRLILVEEKTIGIDTTYIPLFLT